LSQKLSEAAERNKTVLESDFVPLVDDDVGEYSRQENIIIAKKATIK
jgi:hypothetical protein